MLCLICSTPPSSLLHLNIALPSFLDSGFSQHSMHSNKPNVQQLLETATFCSEVFQICGLEFSDIGLCRKLEPVHKEPLKPTGHGKKKLQGP